MEESFIFRNMTFHKIISDWVKNFIWRLINCERKQFLGSQMLRHYWIRIACKKKMQFSEQSCSLANPSHYIKLCNAKRIQVYRLLWDYRLPINHCVSENQVFLHSCVVVLYFLTTTGALIMSPSERKWFFVVLLNEKYSGNQHLLKLYRIINKTILNIHCHLYETGFSLLFTVEYHTKPLRLQENLTIIFIK